MHRTRAGSAAVEQQQQCSRVGLDWQPASLAAQKRARTDSPLRTWPKTPGVVVAPKGEDACPNAGVCWPKGEGELAPKGLELAPKPAGMWQGQGRLRMLGSWVRNERRRGGCGRRSFHTAAAARRAAQGALRCDCKRPARQGRPRQQQRSGRANLGSGRAPGNARRLPSNAAHRGHDLAAEAGPPGRSSKLHFITANARSAASSPRCSNTPRPPPPKPPKLIARWPPPQLQFIVRLFCRAARCTPRGPLNTGSQSNGRWVPAGDISAHPCGRMHAGVLGKWWVPPAACKPQLRSWHTCKVQIRPPAQPFAHPPTQTAALRAAQAAMVAVAPTHHATRCSQATCSRRRPARTVRLVVAAEAAGGGNKTSSSDPNPGARHNQQNGAQQLVASNLSQTVWATVRTCNCSPRAARSLLATAVALPVRSSPQLPVAERVLEFAMLCCPPPKVICLPYLRTPAQAWD